MTGTKGSTACRTTCPWPIRGTCLTPGLPGCHASPRGRRHVAGLAYRGCHLTHRYRPGSGRRDQTVTSRSCPRGIFRDFCGEKSLPPHGSRADYLRRVRNDEFVRVTVRTLLGRGGGTAALPPDSFAIVSGPSPLRPGIGLARATQHQHGPAAPDIPFWTASSAPGGDARSAPIRRLLALRPGKGQLQSVRRWPTATAAQAGHPAGYHAGWWHKGPVHRRRATSGRGAQPRRRAAAGGFLTGASGRSAG